MNKKHLVGSYNHKNGIPGKWYVHNVRDVAFVAHRQNHPNIQGSQVTALAIEFLALSLAAPSLPWVLPTTTLTKPCLKTQTQADTLSAPRKEEKIMRNFKKTLT